MPYYGPTLDPVPASDSVWTWLFGRRNYRGETAISQTQNGFRDAATNERVAFRDIEELATYTATTLSSIHGLKETHTVAILASNSIQYAIAMFAAGRIGAIVTILPTSALATDISYYLTASNASMVFYDKSTAAEVQKACSGPEAKRYILFSLDETSGEQNHISISQLIRRGKAQRVQAPVWTIPDGKTNSDVCAFLAFSSGTTGKPKAVMISHANLIAQCMQVKALIPGPPGVLLAPLPFYHITGLVHLIHLPLFIDQEVVIMSKFNMEIMLQTIVNYRCQELWLVPPLLIRLVTDDTVKSYDLSHVKQFNTGAAPLPEHIIDMLALAYPGVALRQSWGMTESCSCITTTPPDLATYTHAAKVGKPVAGTELKVMDVNTGEELPLGREGELWVRGPQVTMGYLNNVEETRRVYDSDGFLHTGDLGTIQSDGFVTVHDRIKEMIKVRGHGVAPAELEDTLLGHPKVLDAAVIGVPHEYSGEVPKAYVVIHRNTKANSGTAKELQEYIEQNKARHMRLAGGVRFVDVIPKVPPERFFGRC